MNKELLKIVCYMLLLTIPYISLYACNNENSDYNTYRGIFYLNEEMLINVAEYHREGNCGCKETDLFDCPEFLQTCEKMDRYTVLGYTGDDPDFSKNFYVAVDKKGYVQFASFPSGDQRQPILRAVWVLDNQGNTIYATSGSSLRYIYSRYYTEYKPGEQRYDKIKESKGNNQSDFELYYFRKKDFSDDKINIVTMDFKVLGISKNDSLDNYDASFN